MTKRTPTASESVISLPSPDGRIYDFTKTADEAPHVVQISVPPHSTFTGPISHWNEHYKVLFTCISGRGHAFRGTSPYSSADSFFGAGYSETYDQFTLHYWGREGQYQATSESYSHSSSRSQRYPESERILDANRDLEKGIDEQVAITNSQDVLTVGISPSPDFWDQRYCRRHELLHRNWASMELDAALYPSLPSTPLPIRLLFKLPRFLFPDLLRNWLVAYFLSIQLLVLFSALDHHPKLGEWPVMDLYALIKFPEYWGPFAPQLPEWVCRCQWASMIFVSHWKIWIWSGIGRWVLGMKVIYEEYTPERLRDALDPMSGEPSL